MRLLIVTILSLFLLVACKETPSIVENVQNALITISDKSGDARMTLFLINKFDVKIAEEVEYEMKVLQEGNIFFQKKGKLTYQDFYLSILDNSVIVGIDIKNLKESLKNVKDKSFETIIIIKTSDDKLFYSFNDLVVIDDGIPNMQLENRYMR